MKKERLGFTLVELAVTLVATSVLACFALVMGQEVREKESPQARDAARLRETHRGMVMWAKQNNDWYPLASKIARDGKTIPVPDSVTAMDATSAVYSILVFNSLTTPDWLISAAERSDVIEADEDYEYCEPESAVEPQRARWDPAFRGTPFDAIPGQDPEAKRVGNVSFAHLSLAGLGRRSEWKYSLSPNFAALGNRGPEESAGTWESESGKLTATTLADGPTGARSVTLLIHGEEQRWEGNVVYNDNHVSFEKTTHPEAMRFVMMKGGEQKSFGDGLFLDEGDSSLLSEGVFEDTRDANCFLGLFQRGPSMDEYRHHEHVVRFNKEARWLDGMKEPDTAGE